MVQEGSLWIVGRTSPRPEVVGDSGGEMDFLAQTQQDRPAIGWGRRPIRSKAISFKNQRLVFFQYFGNINDSEV